MKQFLKKLSILFSRQRFRRDLDEEISFHREQTERGMVADGMKPEAARHAAMRQFGNATRARENAHEAVAFRLEHLVQDLRYAVRQAFRAPGFALAVIGTLTLGIGATTAIFTLVYSTLIRDLPYPGAERIVRIEDVRTQGQSTATLVGVPRLFDLEARARSFESIGFFFFESATLIDGERLPVSIRRAGTNAAFWRVYGTQPLLGRIYDERDDRPNAPQVAVLSYRAWQRLYGGDRSVV